MTPSPNVLTKAQRVADEFNARHAGRVLVVNAHAEELLVFAPTDFDTLEVQLSGWFTGRAMFEHLRKRAATHGELVNLGRQLGKRYPRQKRGPTSYYFIAPVTR